MAANAKYAGLRGDMVLLQFRSGVRAQRRPAGFPARSALVRRLAMKKAVFGEDTQTQLQAHRDTTRSRLHGSKLKQNNR